MVRPTGFEPVTYGLEERRAFIKTLLNNVFSAFAFGFVSYRVLTNTFDTNCTHVLRHKGDT